MTEETFAELLKNGLGQLDIKIDDPAVERLEVYFRELKKWGRKINLISMGGDDRQIIESHFIDSLALLPLVTAPGAHLLDIGTGAGFPGLVLKAAVPDMQVTLVEPRKKRVSFLNHIIRTLALTGVTVLPCRADDENLLPSDLGATHVTSRAVTEIKGFVQMTARFAQPGVLVICMKGPKWQEEIDHARTTLEALSLHLEKSISYSLPYSEAKRSLIVFIPGEVSS